MNSLKGLKRLDFRFIYSRWFLCYMLFGGFIVFASFEQFGGRGGLGYLNKWLCCSLWFVWFARFGAFESGHIFNICSKYDIICFSVFVYSVCRVWIV